MSAAAARRDRRAYLSLELIALFIAPAAAYVAGLRFSPIPVLLVAGLGALLVLAHDRTFDRRQLWNAGRLRSQMRSILLLAAVAAAAMVVGVIAYLPGKLFVMPLYHPMLWIAVLVLYPLLSVYPQELLYRAFFFHRYRPLFGNGPMCWFASAILFAWVHIIFGNFPAVALSFVGGLLFSWRYARARSLCVVCVEHSLYGMILFTVGLGGYFYHGTTRFVETLVQ